MDKIESIIAMLVGVQAIMLGMADSLSFALTLRTSYNTLPTSGIVILGTMITFGVVCFIAGIVLIYKGYKSYINLEK